MGKIFWLEDTAKKHIKIAAIFIMLSGIFSLILSFNDFLQLGENPSAFIFPYSFNLFSFVLSGFQLYVGKGLSTLKSWRKKAVFVIAIIRVLLSFFFDNLEFFISAGLLIYPLYVLRFSKAGWLFKNAQQNTVS